MLVLRAQVGKPFTLGVLLSRQQPAVQGLRSQVPTSELTRNEAGMISAVTPDDVVARIVRVSVRTGFHRLFSVLSICSTSLSKPTSPLAERTLKLDHLRSGKCDAQHLGPEVHEHCRIAVLGADHGTEAVPIMADSIAHGVRHYSDGWRLVEGTSWEGPRGAGAARSHASSVRPLGRAGAPLPEVNARAGLMPVTRGRPLPQADTSRALATTTRPTTPIRASRARSSGGAAD